MQRNIGAHNWATMCVHYGITMSVSKVASEQAIPTKALLDEVNRIVKYLPKNANTAAKFRPGNMQLYAVSGASFSSET
jgi:hypothetical protein